MTEFLMIGATLSPQDYVYYFAYGMDVSMKNGVLQVSIVAHYMSAKPSRIEPQNYL